MSNEEKRPTLIRFVMTTYQKLLKATGDETVSRGHQVTVPKLTEEIMEIVAEQYAALHKIATVRSRASGSLVTVPDLLDDLVKDAIKKHGKDR